MTREIIEGIQTIEREKGIESGTLIEALEDALLAAYKKTPGATRHATVELDQDTGDFRVFSIDLPGDIEERLVDEVSGQAAARALVVTVSDRSARGEREDTSGPLLAGLLAGLGMQVDEVVVVPDEVDAVQHLALAERDPQVADGQQGVALVGAGAGAGPGHGGGGREARVGSGGRAAVVSVLWHGPVLLWGWRRRRGRRWRGRA